MADMPAAMRGGTLYIGLMSGTSLDGVDAVLADFSEPNRPQILASHAQAMPAALRATLLALNAPGPDELARAALAANTLADLYTEAVHAVLADASLQAHQVAAIGAHGQTVRHEPGQGYTLQLNAPARLAERTGIDVIADFRSRDVAAGGQGAPLTPAFHAAMFANGTPRAILNLGGIANLTLLDAQGEVLGFDTGPANMLLDAWADRHLGQPYDADGRWAASGQVCPSLLDHLLGSEPWFALPPPKSTGRDLFHEQWLLDRLAQAGEDVSPADIQATLTALTASTVADALQATLPHCEEVLACGGGVRNPTLMAALSEALPCPVVPTDARGIPAQWMEAAAFAWLARAHVVGEPGNRPAVTGAVGARILGCRYPA